MALKDKSRIGENIYLVLIYLFLFLPILVVITYSFNSSKMNIIFQSFTVKWYYSLLQNSALLEALTNTLLIAATSTLVSGVIGTMGALGMHKYDFCGKKIIDALLYIPVVIPEIVLGISLLIVFSLLKLKLGLFTIILAHITFSIPFVVITVRARLAILDKFLEEASLDLGATRLKTFFNITLPLVRPGVLSGLMLVFTLSLDDVIITFFTAGPGSNTLPLKIFAMMKIGVSPEVNALFTLIMAVTIIGLGGVTFFQINKLKMTVK
ncbi:ABC transporter permease [Pectinatus sottacetonis]|uniref:ABC transporter permease n=1 Tax=Pectinatus sottacetonis TaxID=1002795 RepID=UPI0018C6C133|nr:ABC transporter permease [Pectinatus sottacetonis]